MTTINVYLTFNGNCEEAFNFYQSILGGEFGYIGRFKEMPPQEGMPPLPDDHLERIMHISLPISKETILMGSDTGGEWAKISRLGIIFPSPSIRIRKRKQSDFSRAYPQVEILPCLWEIPFGAITSALSPINLALTGW